MLRWRGRELHACMAPGLAPAELLDAPGRHLHAKQPCAHPGRYEIAVYFSNAAGVLQPAKAKAQVKSEGRRGKVFMKQR